MSDIHGLTMPKWGLSMKEGRITGWLVKEGAQVRPGMELVEIETDKILSALEAQVSGILRRQLARQDDVVPVRGLLGVIADAAVPDPEIDAFVADFQTRFVPEEAQQETSGPAPQVAEVQGRRLRYLKRGEGGEAAILIHGFGGDLNGWSFNHEALAADRAVFALELPGHGGSSKQVRSGSLSEFAETLEGFLDAVGVTRAHLVGHSMGGAVALTVALASQERVLSLALIGSAGLGAEVDVDYIHGFVTASRRKDLKPQLEKLFADPRLVPHQLVDDVLKYKRLDGVESALRVIAAEFCAGGRQTVVLRDRLNQLSRPVLVIWGAEDRILPATHAQGLPAGVRVEILPGAGHMAQMEAASTVNRLIRSHWDSVPT